jgi:S1/P1 Nuclease
VGDLHQPLHVSRSSDRGGNSIHVKFEVGNATFPHGTLRRRHNHHHQAENLHAVWDDAIIETCLKESFFDSRVALENFLFEMIEQAKNTGEWDAWVSCPDGGSRACTTLWAEESLEYALLWAYANVDGSEIMDGTTLSRDYFDSRLPIVKLRLAVAGARLATTLEICLKQ